MSSINIPVKALLALAGPSSVQDEFLTVLMEPDGTGVWRDLVSRFNREHPGPAVHLIEGPPATNTREDMYTTSFLSGGAGYDIVYCDVIWIPKFVAAGWLLDLTDLISEQDRADYLPVELRAGSYQWRLYRMPAFTDAGVLYYRKDLVAHPPETFDELMQIALRLKTNDRWGLLLFRGLRLWADLETKNREPRKARSALHNFHFLLWQGKQYEGLITVYLEVLWGYGGEWIDDESRKVLVASPEAVQALEFLKATIGKISPPAVTTYIEEDTRSIFQYGRAVFLRNWPYVWTLIQRRGGPIKDQIGVAPMVHAPRHSSAATLGGWGFAISKFCPNPQRAWQFVQFLTRPEQLRAVQQRQGRIPSRRNLIPAEFLSILDSARMRPRIPEYAQASDILQRWLSAALTGQVTADEALREAARETQLLLAS